ncbi:MAG: hypothetical protein ACTSWY_07905 [Promethearchaeota archaeon]
MNKFLHRNKFIRKDLLNMYSNITKSASPNIKEEDIEPVLDRALNNFKREMKQPIEEFNFNKSPQNLKAHIFNVLTKHFVLALMNEKLFIEDGNLPKITKRIEDLLN